MCQKKERTKMLNQQSLLDSGSLPSAIGTQQRPNCTRQSLCRVRHSAKNTRQKNDRQSPLCRVSFIGHSAKALPRAPGALSKEKRPSRHRPRLRSLCRVPTLQALGKDFLFFLKKNSLPSALYPTLGNDVLFFFLKILCRVPPGRRSAKCEYFLKKILCRVPSDRHSAKFDFF